MPGSIGPTFAVKDPYVQHELQRIHQLLQQRVKANNLDIPNVAAELGKAFQDGQLNPLERFLDGRYTGRRARLNAEDNDDYTLYLGTTGNQPCLYLDDQGSPTYIINTSVAGCYLTSGGTWQSASARDHKTALIPVNHSDVVERLKELPIFRWQYKNKEGRASGERHIGPMAEDWGQAFRVSGGTGIAAMDLGGVALAALQWAIKHIEKLEERVLDLEERLNADNTTNDQTT